MNTRSNLLSWLGDLWSSRLGVIFQSLVIGLIAGCLVLGFRIALGVGESFRAAVYGQLRTSPLWYTLLWTLGLIVLGLFLGLVSQRWPMIKGSGIPQIKGELLGKMSHSWLPELPLKLVSGVLAMGAGLSLGREGPSVQMGAYIGKAISRIGRRSPVELRYLMISGSSAGLAAAFNAPLAGVIFALEELNKHFSPLLLVCAMAASAAGDFVSSHFFGLRPSFDFPPIAPLPLIHFPWLILMGLIASLGGDLFKRVLYLPQDLYASVKTPIVLRPVLALLLSIPLGFFLFDATGGGHDLVEQLALIRYSLGVLGLLFIVKLAFTGISYASGTAGGIFLPLLVCGALLGTGFGTILYKSGFILEGEIINFLILGMAAFFTAVVRAPVTGAVLILEMSGNLSHLGGLVVVCLVSQVACDLIRSRPVYDVLLCRQLIFKAAGPKTYRQE